MPPHHQPDLFGASDARQRAAFEARGARRMASVNARRALKPTFPIRSGVPIPTSTDRKVKLSWHDYVYPFDQLEVGQCFDVPTLGRPIIKVQNHLTGAASTYCKQFAPGARRFTTRQIEGALVRCWRTQ